MLRSSKLPNFWAAELTSLERSGAGARLQQTGKDSELTLAQVEAAHGAV